MTDLQAAKFIKEKLPEIGTVIVSSQTHVTSDDRVIESWSASIFRRGQTDIIARGTGDTSGRAARNAVAAYFEATK